MFRDGLLLGMGLYTQERHMFRDGLLLGMGLYTQE